MQMFEYRFVGLALIVSVSLAGCMDGANGTSGPRNAGSGGTVERDVEDPNVFSKRENGLWDGRPSLGGVWVAHPDVNAPERVIIRNTTNGQETIGALFRRERMNPGPAFQVSGEAATAVGMLAGAPTMIEVVALRVEEPEPAPAPVEVAAAEPAAADPATAPAAAPERPSEPAPGPADAPASGDTMIAMPAAEPERRGLFGRLFGRNQTTAPPETATSEIDTRSLGDAPDVPAATPPATPSALTAQAPAPAPAPAPASTLAQPFIQLGIFSIEANADSAGAMVRRAGMAARVVEGRAQGNRFWRVIVGPASTQAELRQNLAKVKSLGFNDAYPVRR